MASRSSNLIQAAGEAYGVERQGNFVNYGGMFGNKLKSAAKEIGEEYSRVELERKIQAENNRKELEGYINQYPADFDFSQLSDAHVPAIRESLMSFKNIYSEAAKVRVSLDVGTREYQEQSDIMNRQMQAAKNLKSQVDLLGTTKLDYIADMNGGNISEANDPMEQTIHNKLATDQIPFVVDQTGNLLFDIGYEVRKMSDFKDIFEKARKQSGLMQDWAMDAYAKSQQSGVQIDDTTSNYLASKLDDMMEDGGSNVIKSLAFDKLMAGKSLLDRNNPENNILLQEMNSIDPKVSMLAKEKLKLKVSQRFIQTLTDHSKSGSKLYKSPAKTSTQSERDRQKNNKDFELVYTNQINSIIGTSNEKINWREFTREMNKGTSYKDVEISFDPGGGETRGSANAHFKVTKGQSMNIFTIEQMKNPKADGSFFTWMKNI